MCAVDVLAFHDWSPAQPQKDFAQLLQGPVNPDLDRAGVDAEQLGDRLVLHAAVARQDDQLPLVLAQLQQRAPEQRRLLVPFDAACAGPGASVAARSPRRSARRPARRRK